MNNNVDAVFLTPGTDKTNGMEVAQMLHRYKSTLPVFIISQNEQNCEEDDETGENDYIVQPVTEQQLKDAIQSAKNKKNAS